MRELNSKQRLPTGTDTIAVQILLDPAILALAPYFPNKGY